MQTQEEKDVAEKSLNKIHYADNVNERNNIAYEISALKAVMFVNEKSFLKRIRAEIQDREEKLERVEHYIFWLTKKLDIETPTIHTEL
jgi:hypothetical protein